jgi:DNA-binding CsgD family transcriptional regulator
MQNPVNKTNELQKFINSIYSQDLSNDLLKEQSELICNMMDSHYFATILFSNRNSIDNYNFSNNPSEFNEVYSQMQDNDVLMHAMIRENGPVLYNDLKTLDLPGSQEFFAELNPLRPVSDCCYFPMTLNGRLCGFNGIARADDKNRIFNQNDLEQFKTISGFINESFIRSMSAGTVEDYEAELDADGNILSAGKAIEEYFRFVFGDKHWKSPCIGNSYCSLLFTQHLREFINPLAQNGSGSMSLPSTDYPATLEFKKICSPEYRSIFRDQPQVIVSISKYSEDTVNKGNLDWQLLNRRYGLSGIEADIIDCIYRGLCNRDISTFLRVNETVVEQRINDIYNKIGVDSRSSLILSLI